MWGLTSSTRVLSCANLWLSVSRARFRAISRNRWPGCAPAFSCSGPITPGISSPLLLLVFRAFVNFSAGTLYKWLSLKTSFRPSFTPNWNSFVVDEKFCSSVQLLCYFHCTFLMNVQHSVKQITKRALLQSLNVYPTCTSSYWPLSKMHFNKRLCCYFFELFDLNFIVKFPLCVLVEIDVEFEIEFLIKLILSKLC